MRGQALHQGCWEQEGREGNLSLPRQATQQGVHLVLHLPMIHIIQKISRSPRLTLIQAYAVKPLEGWQVSKLQRAYAKGRRKVSVSRERPCKKRLAMELTIRRAVLCLWKSRSAVL